MTGVEFAAIAPYVAGASLAATVIGTGVSVYSNIQQADAQAKQAAYGAAVARNNATIAGYNQQQALQAGEAKAQRQGMADRARLSAIRAAQASSGTDVNSDSNVNVAASEHQAGLENVDTIRHNALMEAYGYSNQATSFKSQAELNDAAAKNASAMLPLKVGSSLLEGVSSLGSKWVGFQQKGVFGGSSTSSGSAFGNAASDASNKDTYG